MVVLMVGMTGAGKSTYAKAYAEKNKAVVYSIDNWMKTLFGDDMPDDPDSNWFFDNHKWYTQKITRCENQILSLVTERGLKNQKSVLDLGFTQKEHRGKFIKALNAKGIETQIHYLDVDYETCWERVQKRNKEKGKTFVMTVTKDMFEYMEDSFQVPKASETRLVKVNVNVV